MSLRAEHGQWIRIVAGPPGRKTVYLADTTPLRLSGTVVVQFVVDEQGRPLDPAAIKASSPELSAGVIRLVRLMPWRTPGRQQDQPVRVRCTRAVQLTFRR